MSRVGEPSRFAPVQRGKVASNATIALMSRAVEEVAREAIELSQEERLLLARILLEGCVLPAYPINEAEQTWEEEIADRIRAIDSGTAKARSWEDVLGDVNRRLAERFLLCWMKRIWSLPRSLYFYQRSTPIHPR